ncbi:ABC transporter ATP-binding protein [Natronobiforma cellulositropha]|uniref:ABC transporter ATP-binding protein n=1 Tax=Natronobiforma cellulositropha TaxID=1679076 RepID=UPI0021D57678|nr:ABC transporter ATP-binding protein [Natronobiforma cellulositropha]
MIEVSNLRKEYGGFVAVEDSTFSVARGEVFGVVGPNGAGKTTTLKTLAGLIEPTAGTATVAGLPAGDPETAAILGFLPEESPLYEEMTATAYLEFFADLYDVPRAVARERIAETLDRLDLEHRERRIGNMSKGMKRKVAIARALVNDPEVLIFDEPASGLDPLTTNYIVEFTRELSEAGKTVVFSAHNLFHVESICDRVIIMADGNIVARGSLEEIREAHGGTTYHVYATVETAVGVAVRENGHVRHTVSDMDAVDDVRRRVETEGGRVVDIQTHTPSLEEIFLDVARREEAR